MKCPRCGGNGFVDTSCMLCGYCEFKIVEAEKPITQEMTDEEVAIPKAYSSRRPLSEGEKASLRAYKHEWFEKKKQDPAWYEAFKEKQRARKREWNRKRKLAELERGL